MDRERSIGWSYRHSAALWARANGCAPSGGVLLPGERGMRRDCACIYALESLNFKSLAGCRGLRLVESLLEKSTPNKRGGESISA